MSESGPQHVGSEPDGPLRRWLGTLPVGLLLAFVVLSLTGERLHGRVLALGEATWPGYGLELRQDPAPPSCDPERLEEAVRAAATAPAELPVPEGGGCDPDDPFCFDEPAAEPPEEAAEAAEAAEAGAPGGCDPDDPFCFDEPAAEAPAGAEDAPGAAEAEALSFCLRAWEEHEARRARITPAVRTFRSLERPLQALSNPGSLVAWVLLSLVLLGGATATAGRGHIALRPPRSLRGHRAAEGAMLLANLVLVASFLANARVIAEAASEEASVLRPALWCLGLLVMSALNLRNLLRPPPDLPERDSALEPFLTPPLYAGMALLSAAWFWGFQGHPAGPAIRLDKLFDFYNIYLSVALFILAGMLLAQTRVPHKVFGLLRPWGLHPALLAWVVVSLAAVPTAYSGASGIFVIAAGAVVYSELRSAGADRTLALSATAMSGSLGVVISPSLLVVAVAALDRSVSTGEIYPKGALVFGLSSVLYLGALVLVRRPSLQLRAPSAAVPEVLTGLRALGPDLALGMGVLLVYGLLLDTPLNESTFPFVLPVVFLAVMAWDRRRHRVTDPGVPGPATGLERAVSETTAHLGALLVLMGLSVCLGGVVQDAGVMELVPADLGSPLLAMGLLVVVLVVIGMTLEPLGAIFLVAATLAPVARDAGIAPVHFWLTVLVAFELGYLSPPVALNHLLTRQVVGAAEQEAEQAERAGHPFLARHERLLLPVGVMGTTLLLVAFVPLFL